MESFDIPDRCPRCDHQTLKAWSDLNDEERMLVEKLPGSATYKCGQRKKHRFCMRCLYEEDGRQSRQA